MNKPRPVQVIAVSSGKGGVGKSNVAINLGIALAEKGRRVVVLDAGLGLGNVNVLLGLTATRTLQDVVSGNCSLEDVLVEGPGGIRIAPASSGNLAMNCLSSQQHAGLIHAFSDLGDQIDILIVDTSSGISESVISFLRASQEILLVLCDEPTSIADAYALIRLMNQDYGTSRFRILANQVRNDREGSQLFEKLTRVTGRFLDAGLQYAGAIPHDEAVRKAVQRQRAFMETYPKARASLAMRALADKVESWPLPAAPGGHLEFFVERLVGA